MKEQKLSPPLKFFHCAAQTHHAHLHLQSCQLQLIESVLLEALQQLIMQQVKEY